nr:protein MON2 [Hymenolepis microstoma]
MPEVLNLIQLVERLQQDYRNVINETKRKFIPIKDSAEAQSKQLKELINGNQDIRIYLLEHNLDITNPFIKGCETGQPKIINICLTAIQRLITSQALTEPSMEFLLKAVSTLADSELEELKLLQTTILLVTASQTLPDVILSQALGICLRLHNSKTNSVVNTAAAAIRQCTGSVFDQVAREVMQSPSPAENIEGGDKADAFHFTPISKSAFFYFQDLCLLTVGEIPHWLLGVESISPLLGLELIEGVLCNYVNLFSKEKEFLYLLKERVCGLIIKLTASGLLTDVQRGGVRDSAIEGSTSGVGNAYSGSTEFGVNVRLNRIIILLCSKYFGCLNTECEMLISTLIRIVENERNSWRRALALEVMFKIISQPDLLLNICLTFDMMEPPSQIFFSLVTTVSTFVQTALLNPSSHRESSGSVSTGPQIAQKPAFIYRGANHYISDMQKFALLEILERHEAPALPEGYSLRMTISCLLQIVWSLQHLIRQAVENLGKEPSKEPPIEFKMLSISWTAILPALTLLLEACSDEKLIDSFLLAVTSMVVLSGHCGITDARETFLVALCKFALPSLSVLSEKNGSKHYHQQQNCDEATDRSPIVIIVNANHGPGNLILESSPSPGGNSETSSITTSSSGSNGSTSLFVTAKHIQISQALLELAKTNGALFDSSWYLVLNTMQQLVWMLGLKSAPAITTSTSKPLSTDTQTTTASMSLDTSFFENSNTPAVSTQGGAAVSKVVAKLPILSQTLSDIFEETSCTGIKLPLECAVFPWRDWTTAGIKTDQYFGLEIDNYLLHILL